MIPVWHHVKSTAPTKYHGAYLQSSVHCSRDLLRLARLPHMLAEALDGVLLIQLLEAALADLC